MNMMTLNAREKKSKRQCTVKLKKENSPLPFSQLKLTFYENPLE
jgi:hypothetical protein